jgi:hypothetical protein
MFIHDSIAVSVSFRSLFSRAGSAAKSLGL